MIQESLLFAIANQQCLQLIPCKVYNKILSELDSPMKALITYFAK